ncbi:putative quinol monooxygenase [Streptomyces inhibens]|uniref:putative quinol monooxygenase n=1 Tax=Streptomyces inhibens TaxID=2293571 RepID=UPI0037B7CCA5
MPRPGSAPPARSAFRCGKSHEPGTLTYVSHIPDGDPLVRVLYELYVDRAAFEAHEAQPHTKHFLAEREKHLVSVEVTFLNALDGKVAAQPWRSRSGGSSACGWRS